MRISKLICLLTASCLATIFLTACHKNNEQPEGCALQYPSALMAPPVVKLQLVDSQNRDLLSPATPNHYDSLALKQLNPINLTVITTKYPGNKTGKNFIQIYYPSGEHTTIYSLSSTDQDTVYTNSLVTISGCTSSQKLTAFKYNGKPYTDTLSTGSFVIVK